MQDEPTIVDIPKVHRITDDMGKRNLIIGVTGSVATIKIK